MTKYRLRPGLQILLWSVFITLCINHFIPNLNPFLGLVCSVLVLILVVGQLIFLRKHGLVYVGIFLLCLLTVTAMLLYFDNLIFSYPKRYYSTAE
ncbi:hypothetical protein BH09BAC4_BH09BAC4_03450 [soil metagenome]